MESTNSLKPDCNWRYAKYKVSLCLNFNIGQLMQGTNFNIGQLMQSTKYPSV